MGKINLYYFGSDGSWDEIKKAGFNRRNTNILLELGKLSLKFNVYNVRRTTKCQIFNLIKSRNKTNEIIDVFVCSIIPEHLDLLNINLLFTRLLVLLQTLQFLKKKDIVWCYWPKGYLEACFLKMPGKWIFDADHNIIEDPNIEDKVEREKLLLHIVNNKKVITVTASTRSMLEWFDSRGKKSIRLRNGVALERFQDLNKKSKGAPIIGYCGTLSKWINWDWLFYAIEQLPNHTFVFAGSPYKSDAFIKLNKYKNVKLMGFVKSYKLPQLLNTFDITIGLYLKHKALDVDSMKIYEYLACNKPVIVNNYHDNLNIDFNNYLKIVDSKENFVRAIKDTVIENKNYNLTYFTWESRVKNFISALELK